VTDLSRIDNARAASEVGMELRGIFGNARTAALAKESTTRKTIP
jgi:hypothetical protein